MARTDDFIETMSQYCEHIYFQAPENVRMEYPAIRIELADIKNVYSDDSVYYQKKAYLTTVIDYDPDSDIASKISMLPLCSFNRAYVSEGLNHTVFKIFY